MSTRKRIARVTVVALIILGMGSIGSAGAFAAQAIDSNPATAEIAATEQGVLGMGSETSAPLTRPVSATDKVATALPLLATTALVTPAAKAVAPVAKAKAPKAVRAKGRAAKRTVAKTRGSALLKSLGKGWRKARVSWYGPGFYGHTMAGGGKLTKTSMVVAHRSMPFGTKIQFTYRGRSCIAVVRDRGPYVGGRVFDLGPGTARALGFSGVGVVNYRILGR